MYAARIHRFLQRHAECSIRHFGGHFVPIQPIRGMPGSGSCAWPECEYDDDAVRLCSAKGCSSEFHHFHVGEYFAHMDWKDPPSCRALCFDCISRAVSLNADAFTTNDEMPPEDFWKHNPKKATPDSCGLPGAPIDLLTPKLTPDVRDVITEKKALADEFEQARDGASPAVPAATPAAAPAASPAAARTTPPAAAPAATAASPAAIARQIQEQLGRGSPSEGEGEGEVKGVFECTAEGEAEGAAKGTAEGTAEGEAEGTAKGEAEGAAGGAAEGAVEGAAEGAVEGAAEDAVEGAARDGAATDGTATTTEVAAEDLLVNSRWIFQEGSTTTSGMIWNEAGSHMAFLFDDGRPWGNFSKAEFLKLRPIEHHTHLNDGRAVGFAFVKTSNVLASGGQPLDLPGAALRGRIFNSIADAEHMLGWTVYSKYDPEKSSSKTLRTSTPPLARSLHVGA